MRGYIVEKLLDYYEKDYKIALNSYKMMGKMLDKKSVEKALRELKIERVYIYGGGYLGIQLYNAINELVNVKAIVDKSGVLSIEGLEDIPVIDLDMLKKEYSGETVIITLPLYYETVFSSIQGFVDSEKVFYLGEVLEGEIK